MTITLELPQELHDRVLQLAHHRGQSMDTLLLEALKAYIEEQDDSTEAIRAGFLQGWHEAMTHTPARPIGDVLDELGNA